MAVIACLAPALTHRAYAFGTRMLPRKAKHANDGVSSPLTEFLDGLDLRRIVINEDNVCRATVDQTTDVLGFVSKVSRNFNAFGWDFRLSVHRTQQLLGCVRPRTCCHPDLPARLLKPASRWGINGTGFLVLW